MVSVEQQYVKKTPIEHVLLRPDTYIGSVESEVLPLHVFVDGKLLLKKIEYCPGLYKIFDEILVNAADNKQRDPSMSFVKVFVNRSSGVISVMNDGAGVPVVLHKKENCYVPELIFGQLLTSSNYDDTQRKVTGGRNGYGAKLCNIFSVLFVVETVCGGVYYKQIFERNMSVTRPPLVVNLNKVSDSEVKALIKSEYFDDSISSNRSLEDLLFGNQSNLHPNQTNQENDGGILESNKESDDEINFQRERRVNPMEGEDDSTEGKNQASIPKTMSESVASVVSNKRIRRGSSAKKNLRSDFTRITFVPDLARFGLTELSEDFVRLLSKRVHDLCGTVRGISVFLNGVRLEINGFAEYCRLYQQASPLHHSVVNDRWEVAVCASSEGPVHVSFVNSIATPKGGTHVTHVVDGLAEPLAAAVRKAQRGVTATAAHAKSAMCVFVNALIENPAFDSQTKACLTTPARRFGSACAPLAGLLRSASKCEALLAAIGSYAQAKARAALAKSDGSRRARLTGLPKLDDANLAGTARSAECTLILTEGDSAKALAVAGLGVVGRDTYGVFPLRGKLLNVRDAPASAVAANAEVCALKRILGLQHGRMYTSAAGLRYGRVMLMADQDADGSHIKGLILNLLDAMFPSLLGFPFVQSFATPIVRCTKAGAPPIDFFTLPEFRAWSENPGSAQYKVKYYKGLGTSTSADARRYFADLPKHVRPYAAASSEDRAALSLAFAKGFADRRKAWLADLQPGTFLDSNVGIVSIQDFVNRELILFSHADNVRSIPSVVDGFKPGQRKVLFAAFKRGLRSEIKVAQFAGYVAENSAYHHGEQSLCGTIVGLAQSYVGSNNIALLTPSGQFGTRLQGGKDAASPRYLFTALEPITRLIFRPEDDSLLNYLTEDNESIEPEYYVPIVPMVLVNGADGIGTGWSSSIPNHSLLDVIDNVRRIIRGESPIPMTPFYKGFKGSITARADVNPRHRIVRASISRSNGERHTNTPVNLFGPAHSLQTDTDLPLRNNPNSDVLNNSEDPVTEENGEWQTPIVGDYTNSVTKYEVRGTYTITHDTIEISELPIGSWTQPYKEFLETLVTNNTIKDYKEYHTENTVLFHIQQNSTNINESNIEKKLKLLTTITTTNMVCFNKNSNIKRYASTTDILKEFCQVRLDFYTKRKEHMLKILQTEIRRLKNKVNFIQDVTSNRLIIFKRQKAAIEVDLEHRKYDKIDNKYDYLLSMPIYSLTKEKIEGLNAETEQKEKQHAFILSQSNKDLWVTDLNELERAYLTEMKSFEKLIKEEETKRNSNITKTRKSSKKTESSSKKNAKPKDEKNSKKSNKKVKEDSKKLKKESKKDSKQTNKRKTKKNMSMDTEIESDDSFIDHSYEKSSKKRKRLTPPSDSD